MPAQVSMTQLLLASIRKVSLKAGSYLQADAAMHLQCEVLDQRGVLATSPEGKALRFSLKYLQRCAQLSDVELCVPEGPCREFQDVLATFIGYRPEDLCVQACRVGICSLGITWKIASDLPKS